MTAPIATADYVIVGAGSAGCALAYRLSRDRRRSIILIEAGTHDSHWLTRIPKGFAYAALRPGLAWHFRTEEQPRRGRAGEMWPRGRLLGGSSAINGMIYIRGHRTDFDNWAAAAGPQWGSAEMFRVYREMEDFRGHGAERGSGGPLTVTPGHIRYHFAERLIAAGEQIGLPRNDGFNTPDQTGVGYYEHTISDGRRVSAADAFLKPLRGRSNVTVLRGIEIDRLLFAGRKVIGVEGRRGDAPVAIHANAEVILSAGAVQSPKILHVSGIGPGALLSGLGIPVVHANDQVGQHMRDHVGLSFNYALHGEAGHNRALRGAGLARTILRYLTTRRGLLSTGPFEVGAFACSSPEVERPDMQLYFAPLSMAPVAAGKGYLGKPEAVPGLTATGYLLDPVSEGSVAIRSADPREQIAIRPNWLATPEDRAAGLRMVRFMQAYLRQPALARFVGDQTFPAMSGKDDETAILAMLAQTARSGSHTTGTCRMGRGAEAVVDGNLRVRGLDGLRIADCSVMPTLPAGNTSAPAMAIGWRLAELIAEGYP